jgi:hypothetical protein
MPVFLALDADVSGGWGRGPGAGIILEIGSRRQWWRPAAGVMSWGSGEDDISGGGLVAALPLVLGMGPWRPVTNGRAAALAKEGRVAEDRCG